MANAPTRKAARELDARTREARTAREERTLVVEAMREIAKTFSFDVTIPGNHYSGLTNTELLEVRVKREGRDYTRDNKTMRTRVRNALLEAFDGKRILPAERTIERVIAAEVLAIVIKRVRAQGFDIDIPSLTPEYAKRKAAMGKAGEPIGVLTGRWARALEDKGHVDVSL